MNVYEAAQKRISYMFEEFDNIYLSFSGGKDSTVCFHLMAAEARKRKRKFGVLTIDIEANYQITIEHMKYMLEEYKDVIEPMWVALPMLTNNSVSYSELTWKWWDEDKKDVWVREMPRMDYVINLENNPIDYYYEGITFEDFVPKFGDWYGKGKKTACVVGIRTQESLNRWRAIHCEKNSYKDNKFSTQVSNSTYNFYPIFDWTVDDIWTFYGKTGNHYNKFYDLMYQAGISIHKMRIDEPFGNEAKAGLNMFRIIEPKTWVKVVNRVSGANFGNIYSGKHIQNARYKLPSGHTWETFTKFLLNTLPDDAADHYRYKFNKFVNYWINTGCPLEPNMVDLLEKNHAESIINTHQYSNRGNGDKEVIKFTKIVDHIPGLDSKKDLPTWRRLAMCIIKNDYFCKSLSFAITRQQIEKRKAAIKKYKEII